MRLVALLVCVLISFASAQDKLERFVFVEAESLADTGGWVVDQQFMDFMGSPMLLAHGLAFR